MLLKRQLVIFAKSVAILSNVVQLEYRDVAILMSDAAKAHIKQQIVSRGSGAGIRVGVKTAGCSGLSYVLEFVDASAPEDSVFDQGDFQLFVDPKSLIYLDGTELDFVKEGLNEGFKFNNPNMKSECGCGESFHV